MCLRAAENLEVGWQTGGGEGGEGGRWKIKEQNKYWLHTLLLKIRIKILC